jgi:SAM-dependent methyltransferase
MATSDLAGTGDLTQADMVHQLPPARVVDRAAYLVDAARGRSVAHVGFVDRGCWAYHERLDSWLHAHLDRVSARTVGFDVDAAGVERARELGFEAHAVDCTDPAAVAALGLDPFDVVIAGEVIEHVDRSGDFLRGLMRLTAADGRLIVTTPNASGLLNAGAAALVGYEVNHPDHVTLYSCFTLVNLLERHGWEVVEVATYIPTVKDPGALSGKVRVLATGAAVVAGIERLLGRLGRPYAADGLIVTARPRRSAR